MTPEDEFSKADDAAQNNAADRPDTPAPGDAGAEAGEPQAPDASVPPVHSDIWVPPADAPSPSSYDASGPGRAAPSSADPVRPAYSGQAYSAEAAPQNPAAQGPATFRHEPVGAAASPVSGPGVPPAQQRADGSRTAETWSVFDEGPEDVPRPAEPTKSKPKKGRLSGGTRSQRRLAYWLIVPAVLVMALVTGYPILSAFWLSLNNANLRQPDERSFAGLSNYGTVLSSEYWWQSLLVTVIITLFSVLVELALGMAIALVMYRSIFGKGTIRTVVLIPYGIVTVAAAISWKYAWTPGTGYLANLLPDDSAPLTQQIPSIAIIILAEVWKTTPFMALLLLAGLALVPDDLLKAAQVDGAGAWTRFWKIILPLMKPAILVALLFRTLDAFRIFDNIYVLTSGNHGTGSVSMLGYNNLFKAFNLGVGSAISVLIFLCVALIAFVFIKGFGAAAPGSDDEGR